MSGSGDMTRRDLLKAASAVGLMASAGVLTPSAWAQFGTPEQIAEQEEFDKKIPQMRITDQFLRLSVPGYTMGGTLGVSTNSKGHLFVYSRSNPQGIARGGKAAMLWEFDQNHKFVKEWGPNNYAASFAHSVRVDKHDNVWIIDEGSGMIVKFEPDGQPVFWLGRGLEAIGYLETYLEREGVEAARLQANPPPLHPHGKIGVFNRPTDVTWDSRGNIFISDGYGNSRVVKISPGGKWLKTVGTYGSGQDQFNTPHGICADSQDNIYVADRSNRRIQVYDADLNYKRTMNHVASPWTVCVSPGSPEYLYSGDGSTGKIYKFDLSGKMLGWAQTSLGHGADDTGDLVHMITSPAPNVIYIGSASLWDVQKITIEG
ncbi:MAG TPA: 6-bladed beta-propeller [Candidatus Dormibacteraeota bacterium]|nr:6-bladed beta-propeller [Candidatus Dormibacteraeota bacterium]